MDAGRGSCAQLPGASVSRKVSHVQVPVPVTVDVRTPKIIFSNAMYVIASVLSCNYPSIYIDMISEADLCHSTVSA